MSATASAPPTPVEAQGMSRREVQGSSRRDSQSYSNPSRTQSTRSRPSAAVPSPVRAHSSSSRPTSRRVDEILPQQDYETTNVAQSSRKRSTDRTNHTRTESTRSGHTRSSSRHHPTDMTGAAGSSSSAGPAPVVVPMEQKGTRQGRSRTVIPAQTGNWILGKTIGSGSMGKVKLARRVEGQEEVAVKIVPRGSTPDETQQQSRADRERAERSKEVRTAREAAIVTLVDHPFICGMRDVVRTSHHWYMLFEYVNGGQMLDYIISHGKLKEKLARKFTRQISSALDYCHRNSIIHRDLKIENILISKTGDIKIIDFGLSNLFSPRSHLKTFCGSLYFAAPELLQAKAYTGPEVDIWSFGIVLYVLVCGKVPFDDQSMQALHAKIKKGIVEYPSWLSSDCKNLISRMLVTDPKQRATLHEIMNHPWILKGFGYPPENHLPAREPLQLPLDPDVIRAMTGFDFGAPELIHQQLTEVLESDDYQRGVRLAARDKGSQTPRDIEKKRGFGFDFYKRRSSTNSKDTLTAPSTEGLQLGNDPINAFHPLISVYYLVREKQDRDRRAANPGAASLPRSPNEAPLQMAEIAPPQAAHTNTSAYEMPGETTTGGRTRARARTHGEEDVTESINNLRIGGASGPTSPAADAPGGQLKKESAATSLLRRFSTRKRKDTPERNADKHYPPAVTVRSPSETPTTLRKSFSIRRVRERDRGAQSSTILPSSSSNRQDRDLLTPPQTADGIRSGKAIGRSTSVNSAEYRRRHEDREPKPRVTYKEPPATSGSEHSLASGARSSMNEKSRDEDRSSTATPRSGTNRAKSLGHARRESIQARRARREEAKEKDIPERASLEVSDNNGDNYGNAENARPVFLKGLFSVSTTSTKPVNTIRTDIIRVLKQLNVNYKEIRGGFQCRHMPSIDLKKVVDVPSSSQNLQPPGSSHRRRISFGGFTLGGSNDRERDDYRDVERIAPAPKNSRRSQADASYSNSDISDDSLGQSKQQRSSSRRAAGETTTHVQSDLGGSMILEFEILIVKVPLFSLHGIQFKRLTGGTWQYKNMADQILKELRL
ncbi:CAMK/CAMKL/KIN1 protein kinase [Pseudogymnoascus sp. 23342-1-I1]|nr:CAMK/CAMKL/KIN1 protein kinase [Pseudogymnoascus sp. 23342-1-I1]